MVNNPDSHSFRPQNQRSRIQNPYRPPNTIPVPFSALCPWRWAWWLSHGQIWLHLYARGS